MIGEDLLKGDFSLHVFYSYPWIKLFILHIFLTVISIDLLRLLFFK